MKKEQIQKFVLIGMCAVGGLYLYWDMIIAAAGRNKKLAMDGEKALEPKFVEARALIKKVAPFREKIPSAEKLVRQVERMLPAGAAVAWFPPRVTEAFAKHGISRVKLVPGADSTERPISGFRRQTWTARIEGAELPTLLKAVPQWENDDPLTEIASVQMEPNAEDLSLHNADLVLVTLIKE